MRAVAAGEWASWTSNPVEAAQSGGRRGDTSEVEKEEEEEEAKDSDNDAGAGMAAAVYSRRSSELCACGGGGSEALPLGRSREC